MEEGQKPEEVVAPEVTPEAKVEERPEENWKAELDRKNKEIERLRSLNYQRQQEPAKRDQNDIRTWGDHELKAIANSADPSVLPYKEQANDILLERKVSAIRARERETENKVKADLELRSQFPDSVDPSSELSSKIDELTEKYDLSKTPAGRLVAAKLAAAELNQGKDTSAARKTKTEKDRLASVKGQMVDGDRPKPTDAPDTDLDKKRQNLAERLMKANQPGKVNENDSTAAMSEILKDRFGGRKGFFGEK